MQAAWQHLTSLLSSESIETARQEAGLILQHVTGRSTTEFYCELQRPLLPHESSLIEAIVARRLQREPLQYILNSACFYGREFFVDGRVLIPRPETELLVEVSCSLARQAPAKARRLSLVDVGTGSGCIAVTLACELKEVQVLAIDRSRDALNVARINSVRHGVDDRLHLLQGSLVAAIKPPVDAVVANLPYVCSEDIEGLASEVSCFEPRDALDGGPDGLEPIRQLCADAELVLGAGGWLLLEVGEGQANAALTLLSRRHAWDSHTAFRDLRGIDRVVAARRAQARG